MMKEMLIKGGAIVTAIVVAQVVIEKLEKASLKRNAVTEGMDSEEGSELTEKEKWAKLRPRVVETLDRHRKAE
jgi:hypothetical protein